MTPTFIPYDQNQMQLLPPLIEDMVPENHPVRVVDRIVNSINIDSFIRTYQGGGRSSFEPRMLLKVLIYAYMINIYSSRKIEALLNESVMFMWISGSQHPDHNTINRFRLKLRASIKPIFSEIVLMLHEAGMVDIKDLYTDGTKIDRLPISILLSGEKPSRHTKRRFASN